MHMKLERIGSPKAGGLASYELFIQSGVQLQPDGEGLLMKRFADFGEANAGTSTVCDSDRAGQTPTIVQQFIFRSLNDIRFPLSSFFC